MLTFNSILESPSRDVAQYAPSRYSKGPSRVRPGTSEIGQSISGAEAIVPRPLSPTQHQRGLTPKDATLNSAAPRFFAVRRSLEQRMTTAAASPESPPAASLTRNYSKSDIARAKGVTARTVDNWVERGLLPVPMKLGTATQSRVRWTDADIAALESNLAQLRRPTPAA
jgi:predicted DNA-binding transcriptional regulator AlpA